MESEDVFLRRLVVRLRGALSFAVAPETQALLREVIIATEDRLAALNDTMLGSAKR
jgi:hypothetical protein